MSAIIKLLLIWAALAAGVYGLMGGAAWLAEQDWFDIWGKWIGFGGWTLFAAVMIWIGLMTSSLSKQDKLDDE